MAAELPAEMLRQLTELREKLHDSLVQLDRLLARDRYLTTFSAILHIALLALMAGIGLTGYLLSDEEIRLALPAMGALALLGTVNFSVGFLFVSPSRSVRLLQSREDARRVVLQADLIIHAAAAADHDRVVELVRQMSEILDKVST